MVNTDCEKFVNITETASLNQPSAPNIHVDVKHWERKVNEHCHRVRIYNTDHLVCREKIQFFKYPRYLLKRTSENVRFLENRTPRALAVRVSFQFPFRTISRDLFSSTLRTGSNKARRCFNSRFARDMLPVDNPRCTAPARSRAQESKSNLKKTSSLRGHSPGGETGVSPEIIR